MPRYRLTIAYDGTEFCGWQKQEPVAPETDGAKPSHPDQVAAPLDRMGGKALREALRAPQLDLIATSEPLPLRDGEDRPRIALRTVQHVVERAIIAVVREPVVLIGASRTDSGVHAKGQVAAFTCSPIELPPRQDRAADFDASLLPPEPVRPSEPNTPRGAGWPLDRGTDRLLRAINSRLPDDVQVVAAEPTDPDFNPIGGATRKAYSYTFHVARDHARPLWDRRYVHHVHDQLDAVAMDAAARHLVGEHDFASFAASGHGRLSTIRTVYACTATELIPTRDGRRIRIEIVGNGFLWNMVRIIAGTLLDVGRGRKRAADIPNILAARDRAFAGPTLPPTGLCLEWIEYAASGERSAESRTE